MNPNSRGYQRLKETRRGIFRVGVSEDNISKKYVYSWLNAAQTHAEQLTEETGIKFHVYEETTVYRPVS